MRARPSPNKIPDERRSTQEEDDDGNTGGEVDESGEGDDELNGTRGVDSDEERGSESKGKSDLGPALNQTGMPRK